MFPPQSTPSKRPKRRVESYRIYKRPYSACSQSSRPSPSSYEKATHGRLVGPTLSTPRGGNNYNQYRPLCEVCPRDRDKVVGTLQGFTKYRTQILQFTFLKRYYFRGLPNWMFCFGKMIETQAQLYKNMHNKHHIPFYGVKRKK